MKVAVIVRGMAQRMREVVILIFLAIFSFTKVRSSTGGTDHAIAIAIGGGGCYCLSWRMGVEANNIRNWRTTPPQCLPHIQAYMTRGQYDRDLHLIVDHILSSYLPSLSPAAPDGLDAWILDVDDTCISNLPYYQYSKRFGCDPYDPDGFRAWAIKGACPAIPAVLRLFTALLDGGFKVFLLTGRDEATLGQATLRNLHDQGFIGYQQLILRGAAHRGLSAVEYKSRIRKQLEEEGGYRIWGNVGDQWSDLQGLPTANRTFKLPNPMYFVP